MLFEDQVKEFLEVYRINLNFQVYYQLTDDLSFIFPLGQLKIKINIVKRISYIEHHKKLRAKNKFTNTTEILIFETHFYFFIKGASL